MPRNLMSQRESDQSRPRSTKANVTIMLGLLSLVIGAVLFAIAASVIGSGNAALATLSLFLVGVILIVGGLTHRQS